MKKLLSVFLSIIVLLSLLCACSNTETPSDNSQENHTNNTVRPQPPTQDEDEQHDDSATPVIPALSEHQGGGDGYKEYAHWGNDKIMNIPGFIIDSYEKYLGERELSWEWWDYRVSGAPRFPGIMNFDNIYSLAVMHDIPIEIVVAIIDEYNEFSIKIAREQAERRGDSLDRDFLPYYTEEDKAFLLTQDEEIILKHFASPYAIVIRDKVYTPAWLYLHTLEDYEAAGITPEIIEEKLKLYSGINIPDEAAEALSEKLSEFMGRDVSEFFSVLGD